MPYGQAGRLGESIDPRLMQADFSGYANAGMIQGQALAGLGQQIGDAAKQRGQEEKFIKKSEQLAKNIGELIPELQGQAGQALDALNNPDLSHRDRLAMAESIGETLKVGMMSIENQRAKEMMALRRASMAAKGSAGAPMMILTPQEVDQFSNAGYALEIVGRNPDGSLTVKDMTRKAAGGTGGLVPFYNEQTGTFGMQQAPPQSLPPTPRVGGDPSMLQQAVQGFTQPSLPVAGGGASDALLPPRVDAGVAPPAATTATGMVPNADFFAQEGQKAVRVPGSMRDLDAKLKQQQIAKAKAETGKAELEMTEAKTKEAQGRNSFSSYVGSIANAYAELDKAGAAISTRKSPMENIQSFAAGTEFGKSVGAAVGSEASSFRAIIDSQTPGIINVIRQSSEMGAKGMDSDAERKFYITALGTQTLPVEANIRALIELDKAYGNGDVANIVKEKNPALYARAMSDKYVYKSGKKDEFVGDQEVESILQELGL
jgi:hypothetical protein